MDGIVPSGLSEQDKAMILNLITFKISWCAEQIERMQHLGMPSDVYATYKHEMTDLQKLEAHIRLIKTT